MQIQPALDGPGAKLLLTKTHLYAAATGVRLADPAAASAAMQAADAAMARNGYVFLRQADRDLRAELRPILPPHLRGATGNLVLSEGLRPPVPRPIPAIPLSPPPARAAGLLGLPQGAEGPPGHRAG